MKNKEDRRIGIKEKKRNNVEQKLKEKERKNKKIMKKCPWKKGRQS